MSTLGSLDINALIQQLSESADPVMFQYFKRLKERTIIINEEITDASIETVVMPLLEMDNDRTGEEITMYLNTPGGNVYVGLNICDVISKLKTKTTIIILAYAYSMGSLIAMSAYNNPNVTVKCYPFSTALIHAGSTYVSGTTTQVRDYHNFSERYEKMIKEFILNNSKITANEYDKMERYEWYMNSEEMLKYGLVDEII